MPNNNQAVRFIGCSATSYKNLQTYDENTLYFLTDTHQLYLGSQEYTKSITALEAQPNNGTPGESGKLYAYNGNLYMCNITGYTYNWVRIANINDYDGTVTSITAGAGLTGGTITESGTINHAVPVGARAQSDNLSDENPNFGSSFEIIGVATDEFGHITSLNLHTVTLPNETAISLSGTSDGQEALNNESEFEVVIGLEKGTGSHELNLKKKTFKLPKSIDLVTYSIETGDNEGCIKIKSSDGKTAEAKVKDWDKLSKLTDIATVFRYRGKVNTKSELPQSNQTVGDVYYVVDESAEYVYIGIDGKEPWESLGPIVDLSAYALSADVIPRVKTPDAEGKVPVISSDGTLASSGFTLGTNVPSDAKFTDTDTVYSHPTFTPHGLSLYKVEVDEEGHVKNAVQVIKSDITELGIPSENTDTKVTTHPNTTSKFYLVGTASENETNGELQVSPNITIENDAITAKSFHGEADTAIKATSDGQGNNIANTYLTQESAQATYATKDDAENAKLVWQVI